MPPKHEPVLSQGHKALSSSCFKDSASHPLECSSMWFPIRSALPCLAQWICASSCTVPELRSFVWEQWHCSLGHSACPKIAQHTRAVTVLPEDPSSALNIHVEQLATSYYFRSKDLTPLLASAGTCTHACTPHTHHIKRDLKVLLCCKVCERPIPKGAMIPRHLYPQNSWQHSHSD